MARGKFITFEGGEGSGKSTQTKRLAEKLRDAGIPVELTREPGGAPGAEEIRGLLVAGAVDRWQPVSEALLHYAARCEHMATTIRPALDGGTWVVCDRFADSTTAYQGYGHGLDAQVLENLEETVLQGFQPDLTIVLDLSVEDGLARSHERGGDEDRYERMGADFHRRIRNGFLEIADRHGDRCVVIDAGRSVDEVHLDVIGCVAGKFGTPLT